MTEQTYRESNYQSSLESELFKLLDPAPEPLPRIRNKKKLKETYLHPEGREEKKIKALERQLRKLVIRCNASACFGRLSNARRLCTLLSIISELIHFHRSRLVVSVLYAVTTKGQKHSS